MEPRRFSYGSAPPNPTVPHESEHSTSEKGLERAGNCQWECRDERDDRDVRRVRRRRACRPWAWSRAWYTQRVPAGRRVSCALDGVMRSGGTVPARDRAGIRGQARSVPVAVAMGLRPPPRRVRGAGAACTGWAAMWAPRGALRPRGGLRLDRAAVGPLRVGLEAAVGVRRGARGCPAIWCWWEVAGGAPRGTSP